MSNRRHPKQAIALHGNPVAAPRRLPFALLHMEWSDEPAADYDDRTLTWIADRRQEAMRLNAWRCEVCNFPFVAFDRHAGTTPMMVSHHAFEPDTACQGLCASAFYNRDGVLRAAVDLGQSGQVQPSHEWYRPSRDELRSATAAVRDHVLKGGLLVRPVTA